MKPWLAALISLILATGGYAARQGPEVLNLDGKISIHAEHIALGHLLRLWDKATGMRSSVPRDLAARTLSVQFTGLSVDDAVQKIFENQPLNYAVVEGQGIIVTGLEGGPPAEPPPIINNEPQVTGEQGVIEEPVLREKPGPLPLIIPTPFGPMWAPDENQPMIQLPTVPEAPPQPPFFGIPAPTTPPAGAANGPVQNNLFGPLPIYQSPTFPFPNSPEQSP